MKKYIVQFFLHMQGMESASKDWWEVQANSKEEAINKLIKMKYPDNKDTSFFRGCLSAQELK